MWIRIIKIQMTYDALYEYWGGKYYFHKVHFSVTANQNPSPDVQKCKSTCVHSKPQGAEDRVKWGGGSINVRANENAKINYS